MWNDTTPDNGNSWDEVELVTYAHYPNAMPQHDTTFSKSGSNWIPQSTTSYYYNADVADSLQLTYGYDGISWSPVDSVTFTYTLLSSGILQATQTTHTYQPGGWEPVQGQVTWFDSGLGRPDSVAFDKFNVSTLSWDRIAFGVFLYDAQNRLDSIKIRANLSGGVTLLSHQKASYDVQNRLSHLRDTVFVPALSLAIQAADEFFSYLSPTSDLITVDSVEVRSYYPFPGQFTTVSRSSYDANDKSDLGAVRGMLHGLLTL